jgi:hypothetical protein
MELYLTSVEEIRQLSGILAASYAEDESVPIVIDIMEPERLPIDIKRQIEKHQSPEQTVMVLCFSCTAQTREINVKNADGSVRLASAFEAFWIVGDALWNRVTEIVLLAHLAQPGGLETRPFFTVCGDQYHFPGPALASYLRFVVRDALERGWPSLQTLQISNVLNWVQELGWDIRTLGETPVNRALNAFTYVFDSAGGTEQELLYSLVGIEALYAKKREGIAEQIVEKTQIFLGPFDGMKKRLKSMYNFRSRFVHGDLNFPSRFVGIGASKKYDLDLEKETNLAQAILLATLQRMAENHWTDIEFVYTLKPS